jgi:phage I-like protein
MLYDCSMKQGARDSHQRIAFVQLFGEGTSFAEQQEIQVVPTGEWSHPVYGEMEITPATIAEFVKNYKEGVRLRIPITAGHDNGMNGGELPAVGWFTDLIDKGVKGLYAFVEWTEEGRRLLESRAFKYFSPEFYEEYSDPQTGEKRGHVLVGGALTNKPYFKELKPVAAFSEPDIMRQFTDDMNLKDILSKKPEELSAEEKAFVKQNEGELTTEQKEQFKSAIGDAGGETDEQKAERETKEAADAAAAAAAEAATEVERQASERNKGKVITMSEAEATALRTAANQGAKAFAEVEKMKVTEEVKKLVFSAGNAESRLLPKQQEATVALMLSMSEAQRKDFRAFLTGLPKLDQKLFSEVGDAGKENTGSVESIYSEIKGLADAKVIASAGKIDFAGALVQVYAEKPELKTAYEKALETEATA